MKLGTEEWNDRIVIEAQSLIKNQPTFQPLGNSITHWRGEILGTGLYNGVFQVDIRIPRSYPFKAPIVRFLTPIWHVNIYKRKVCVGILGKDWNPSYSIVQIIDTIKFLLASPNPNDPLNLEAATQWNLDREGFLTRVRSYINEFAFWNQHYPEKIEEISSGDSEEE